MGFKEVIKGARERYEKVQRTMEERQVKKREKDIQRFKADKEYYSQAAAAEKQKRLYERYKVDNARLKQKKASKRGEKIKKSFERFSF